MKKLICALTLVTGTMTTLWSQTIPTRLCGIYYDYDAAGNRIRRMYDCREGSVSIGGEPQSAGLNGMGKSIPPGKQQEVRQHNSPTTAAEQVYISLFPNPTSGKYTLKLSSIPEKPVHFHWYTDQMQILSSGSISSETFSGDISTWADAIYILRVYNETEVYTFKVVKVSTTPAN